MIQRLSPVVALACALAGALSCRPSAPEAGELRAVTTFRQMHGERRLDARVQLSGGSLHIAPGRRDELYRMTSTHSEATSMPVAVYNPEEGSLSLRERDDEAESNDTEPAEGSFKITFGGHDNDHTAPTTTLALSPALAAALRLEAVATNIDAELGGLQLSSLAVNVIAGQTTIRFSRPNGIECDEAVVTAGVGELSLTGLGNSRCKKTSVTGVAGKVVLDYGGDWPANTALQATIIVGSLTLRLPRSVGVRLTQRNKLFTDAPEGLLRDGDAFVSADYEHATRRLDVDVTTMLGGTSVEWIGE
jgi:hypothetical protein